MKFFCYYYNFFFYQKEFNKFESLIEELATSKNKYGDI